MKVIILAGGSGTRLWPLSRERYPKQFIKINSKKKSLFQEAFLRSHLLVDVNDIYVVTNEKYKFLVINEVEELNFKYNKDNILVEPEAKNTLPAIYAGVHEIVKKGHDTVVVFPSDHIITKNKEFVELIKASEELILDYLVTFGIRPDWPNTGYGYISPGDSKKNGYIVKAFKEKPTHEKAAEYIENGYFWNSGIFMFDTSLFSEEVKNLAPEIYNAFQSTDNLQEAFSKIETKISIDYGIMEKSSRIVVVPSDIGWNDLGSFDSFYAIFEKDENNNITGRDNIFIDSTNNLVHSDAGKLIGAIGVEDLIIIDSKDALLVCKKDQSQKVKNIIETLQMRNDLRVEYHIQDYRPWGYYTVLEEVKNSFKVKRITIKQGKKLSYQLHYHRNEHWIVIKGMAQVTLDDEVKFVRAGENIYVKAGQKHRIENPGKTPLEIIEVQMGDYLEEDDIVRFDDEYGRK